MTTGELVRKVGNVTKKKKKVNPDEQAWRSVLYAAINARRPMTVEQAAGWFRRKTGSFVPDGLCGMPPAGDAKRLLFVKDVFPWLKPKRRAAA